MDLKSRCKATSDLIKLFCLVMSLFSATCGKQVIAGEIAIDGYDAVAYFTLQKATKGSESINYQWKNRVWHFANSQHRDLFIDNPSKYAPQFDGLCSNGLSDGHAIEANPENWRIIDGKLYLFFSDYGRDKWEGNVKPLLERAEKTYHNQ